MQVIQRIPMPDGEGLFMCSFDWETNELSFRISTEPHRLFKEVLILELPLVKAGIVSFDFYYLEKFLNENA